MPSGIKRHIDVKGAQVLFWREHVQDERFFHGRESHSVGVEEQTEWPIARDAEAFLGAEE
jgi:hypothetical protein